MMQSPPEHADDRLPIVPLMIFFGSIGLLLVVLLASQPVRPGQVAIASTTAEATAEITAEIPAVTWNLDPAAVSAGNTVFHSLCMTCHGMNAEGVPGLGKTLIGSEFVNSLNDEELITFVITGRPVTDPLNTTGVAMPPRGGNPSLGDQDIAHVVAYVRSLNVAAGYEPVSGAVTSAPTAAPTGAATPVPATPVVQPTSVAGAIVPMVGVGELNLAFTSGKAAYTWACSLCHGADGAGVSPYASLPLSASTLVQQRDDAGLLAFLTLAQPPVNPNEAYPHPYRGGYPPLTDDQIREVMAYLYTLAGANS